jgi:hypothetical protein
VAFPPPPLVQAEKRLEEGAEDDGLDARPIFLGGVEEQRGLAGGEFDGFDEVEEAAVEIAYAGVAAAARRGCLVHLAEEPAEEVVAAGPAPAFIHQADEQTLGQQADVLGEHGEDGLETKAAGAGGRFAALDQGAEDAGDILRGVLGHLDPVIAEEGGELDREQEIQRGMPGGQVAELETVHRVIDALVEVVNPELVEVAEDDVGRAVGG